MRILLINSPIRVSAKPNCLPYGLAIIASLLRQDGHEVDIVDVNALRPAPEDIVRDLQDRVWDVAGVSGLITTYEFQKWVIEVLKSIHPQAPVISGGGFATSVPEFVLENTLADIVVVGEGEITMPELCRALESGKERDQIHGLWFRNGAEFVQNPSRSNVENLDDLPFPAWDLLPMEIYLKHPIWGNNAKNSSGFKEGVKTDRSMNIISSRGCPYSCNYCYHLFGRSSYRYRSARNIVDEMECLIERYQVDFIGFNDDNMMASEPRLLEFCSLLKEKKWDIHWGCHGRVTSARPEILREMAEAGCVWIGYGIESGSETMLNAMNKNATVTQAKEAILHTRAAGIYPNTTFIFGYPGENRETIQESVQLKKDLNLQCGSFFATPYPGTQLYEQSRHLIPDENSYIRSLGDATEFTINLTEFDQDELFRLKACLDSNTDIVPCMRHCAAV